MLSVCGNLSLTACAGEESSGVARLVQGPVATPVPGYRAEGGDRSTEHRVALQELGKGCVSNAITELGRLLAGAASVCLCCGTCVTACTREGGRQLTAKQVRREAGEAVIMHFSCA